MKITVKFGTNNIKVVEVSPDDHLYVLLDKLNITDKSTKFIFKGMSYSMSGIQTFQEIGIIDGARITVNYQKIKITCKLGANNIKIVEVSPDDPLYIFLDKLNITDKTAKFVYKGIAYSIGTIATFREIGLTCDARIVINNTALAGEGEE